MFMVDFYHRFNNKGDCIGQNSVFKQKQCCERV